MLESKRYVTPKEAALIMGMSVDHVRALIMDRSLKASNVGRGKKVARYRIDRKEIERFMERRTPAPATKRNRRRPSMEGVTQYF